MNKGKFVAIADYGMGNLFSVERACERAGLSARRTSSPSEIADASAVILPGVGAFADAMAVLRASGIDDALRKAAMSKPFLAICLGMQLLLSKSEEFGNHEGLGLMKGDVVRFPSATQEDEKLRVPQVGWNRIHKPSLRTSWEGTPLARTADGEYMYFVHSYYVRPTDSQCTLAETTYGDVTYASVLWKDQLLAVQYHPERSGKSGLDLYFAFSAMVNG